MNNWTTETIFNRERFEAWLASQPGERQFDYMSNKGCAVCRFIQETTSASVAGVGGSAFRLHPNNEEYLPLPDWVYNLLLEAICTNGNFIKISHLRTAYQKLFGVDVCAEYAANVPAIESPATA